MWKWLAALSIGTAALQGGEFNLRMQPADTGEIALLMSLAVPPAVWADFAADLQRLGGRFYLKGCPNGWEEVRRFYTALDRLDCNVSFTIDPEIFESVGDVRQVPCLVLKSYDGIDTVIGHLPIKEALEKIVLSGTNRDLARKLLGRL